MTYVQLERTAVRFGVDVEPSLAPLVAGLRHYEVLPEAGPDPAPVRLRVADGAEPEVVVGPGRLELRAPVSRCSVETLQMMADLAYYRILDEAGVLILHASVVSNGTATYALWGSSGAGKTTTAVALHERHGFSVLSNGTAMFRLDDGAPHFVGSAKTHVKLRSSSVSASGSPLAAEFAPGAPSSGAPADEKSASYERKVEKQVSSLADPAVGPPLPLTGFYLVRLVRDLPGAELTPVRPERAGVELYEDAVRHLHGLTMILPDAHGGRLARLPVLATERTHAMRRDLVAALLQRAGALSGPLDDVTRCLAAGPGSAR